MEKKYNIVTRYLELAHKNCPSSNESSHLKNIIKSLIFNFNKLNDKKNKRILRNNNNNVKPLINNPEQTLKVIENLIEQERKGKQNEIIDN